MKGKNFEDLDKSELLEYIKELQQKCKTLERMNEDKQKVIAQQNQKLTDFQKKMTDIGSSLRLLY